MCVIDNVTVLFNAFLYQKKLAVEQNHISLVDGLCTAYQKVVPYCIPENNLSTDTYCPLKNNKRSFKKSQTQPCPRMTHTNMNNTPKGSTPSLLAWCYMFIHCPNVANRLTEAALGTSLPLSPTGDIDRSLAKSGPVAHWQSERAQFLHN